MSMQVGHGHGHMHQGQQKATVAPQLDQQSTRELTLTVLQRLDPAIDDILASAGHVTLYAFHVQDQTWSRKDVEGSLFVVKRREQPRFQFIVMNRRSTENLVEDLLGEFEYEVPVPYLLYRNARQEVNGIWFYNQRDCEEIANLFARILTAFSKVPPKAKVLGPPSVEYGELEAVPTAATVDGPLEPLGTARTATVAKGGRGRAAEGEVEEDEEEEEERAQPQEPLERFFSTMLHVSTPPEQTSLPLVHPSPAPSPLPPVALPYKPAPPSLPSRTVSASSLSASHPASLATLDVPSAETTSTAKPSFFLPPPLLATLPQTTSLPQILPASSSLPLQPHGAPLLQPFPPPAPPASLATPSPPPPPQITREGVKRAMDRLLQDERFIDMIYEELVAAHGV